MVPTILICSVLAELKGFASIGKTEYWNNGFEGKALAVPGRRGLR